jgi:hypothetical protein
LPLFCRTAQGVRKGHAPQTMGVGPSMRAAVAQPRGRAHHGPSESGQRHQLASIVASDRQQALDGLSHDC